MFKDVWRKLSNKKYRDHYALSLLKRSVAFQIKTLRKKHCGSQAVLAERSDLTQGVVSRAEDQEYGNLTFNTVGRIAAGLDMAFIGKFVPFGELIRFTENLSESEFKEILTFDEEYGMLPALEALGLGDIEENQEHQQEVMEPMPIPLGPMIVDDSRGQPQHNNPQSAADLAMPPTRIPPASESGLFRFAEAG